jgi:hypothetical protein
VLRVLVLRVQKGANSVVLMVLVLTVLVGLVRQTLRVTAAMEGGVGDHVWSVDEIVRLFG